MEVDFTLSVGALPYHELLVDLAATEFTGHMSFARRTQTVFPPAACHQYRSRACPRCPSGGRETGSTCVSMVAKAIGS